MYQSGLLQAAFLLEKKCEPGGPMRPLFNDVGASAVGDGNYPARPVLTDSRRFRQADVGFPGGPAKDPENI